ncbi:MAG: exodeoxyribonuclease VII large subunit [Chloroflexales bacterium]|nr:exodeoxyribonuclease VII large subunit [Chloroflexales bacterium]
MQILTVTEVNTYLRELLEADEIVRDIWVEGEISNFNRHSSGHCYFSLKHQDAVLRAVLWRSHASQLAAIPRNGDAVLAHGRVSLYEVRGDLQLYVDTLHPAGIGRLHARFERLKVQLEAEGLFDPSRKRPLPILPQRIGIATSVKGAALRDILNVLGRRCPLVEVLVAPCLVQGEQAPASIVAALQSLYNAQVDLIILARGGGSIEDLWAFNDENVARAAFASPAPLITGVGHETDTTIVDYVADMRAPTPSAAAELAVPDRTELSMALYGLHQRLDGAIHTRLDDYRRQLASATENLHRHTPAKRLAQQRQQVDDLMRRSGVQLAHTIELSRARLQGLQSKLAALSPRATLDRGYAVVSRSADGKVVTHSDQAQAGEKLELTLRTGRLLAEVLPNDTAPCNDAPSV